MEARNRRRGALEATPHTPLSEVMKMITEVKERKDDKDAE